MSAKRCQLCGELAVASVGVLCSTVGLTPRRQKLSPTLALCAACIQSCIDTEGSEPHSALRQALISAYTAIGGHVAAHADGDSSTACQVALGDKPASCRTCQIACNSRHNDEASDGESSLVRDLRAAQVAR